MYTIFAPKVYKVPPGSEVAPSTPKPATEGS
jgi:hypothetical protein